MRIRKIWHALGREGIDIDREQTARLMRLAGVSGKGKGRLPVTTGRSKGLGDNRLDLVGRDFRAPGPNRLWVADITYVRTSNGFVYTALLSPMCTAAKLSDGHYPIRCARKRCHCRHSTRRLYAQRKQRGLIHHSDHGWQYVGIVYHERLAERGVTAFTGTVGDSYDCQY